MLDDSDLDLPSEQPQAPPPRPRNRFPVVAGLLGSILLLTLIGLAVYALVILPQQRASQPGLAQATSTQLVVAQQVTNTSTITQTATATRTPLPPTSTSTPVTPLFTSAATQTMNALLTQAALAQAQGTQAQGTQTTAAPTSTPSSLPQSGIQDELGGPGLLIASAAALFLIIIAARRLRNAN